MLICGILDFFVTLHYMKRHSLAEWAIATRPWSFPASVMPVVVTIAFVMLLAGNGTVAFHPSALLNGVLTLLTIVLLHASGNLWSDLIDFRSGVDTRESFSVPTLTSGQFNPAEIKTFAIILAALASALGLWLTVLVGLPVLLFGALALLLTVFYPRLKYNAMGDFDIFITYALLPTLGTAYVMTGRIIPSALWLSLPIGLITVAILHANNTRDVRSDSRVNISTIAMKLGHKASCRLYAAEVLLPFLLIVGLIIAGVLPPLSLLVLIALIPSLKNVRLILASAPDKTESIRSLDVMTAQLQLTFSLLLSVSLIAAALL